MGFEKRKSPKIKVKRKEDKLDKIEMKKSVAPSRKVKSKRKPAEKPISDKPKISFHILKGGAFNKQKKKRNSIITAVIVGVLIFSIIITHLFTPTGIVEWSQNCFSTWGSGGGLPVAVSGDSVRELKTRGECAFIMTDSHMYAYNSSGKQITSVQHGYSEPVLDVSAARTLVYDRGSLGIRVDALYTNIVDTQLNEEIITADICDKGYVAVATESTDYTTLVNVYDKDFKNIFRWSSPDGYVSCLELSQNGKQLAVCTVTGKNGDYCTNINIFKVSSGEKIFTKQILGSMYVSASSNSKHLTLVGTDSAVSFKWDGTDEVAYEYYNLQLVNMDYMGQTALVYHPGGDERRYTVSLLGKDGRQTASFSVDGNVSKLCADKKYVYAYNNGKIQRFLHSGELDKEYKVGYEYVFISSYKNKLSVISDMKLNTYK